MIPIHPSTSLMRSRRGISLVEVVIATLICLTMSATIFASFLAARKSVAVAHHQIVATAWAATELESIRSDRAHTMPAPHVLADNELQEHAVFFANNVSSEIDVNIGADSGYRNSTSVVTWQEH